MTQPRPHVAAIIRRRPLRSTPAQTPAEIP
jgi:hypothetical protein